MFCNLNKKFKEAFFSVFPVTIIIFAVAIFFAPMPGAMLFKFSISAVLLFLGMSFFSLGADTAMIPIGKGISSSLTKSKKIWILLLACFVMGVVITVAEPDLSVLSGQIPSINKWVLIGTVGVGVGVCFLLGVARILFNIKLKYILMIGYAICFLLLIFVPKSFWAMSFDASGVTTGAISVPFIMSFAIGISAMRSGSSSEDDSFGLVATCSIGPILSILLLGLFSSGIDAPTLSTEIPTAWADIPMDFVNSLGISFKDSALVILPILAIFVIFQFSIMKLPKSQVLKILVGLCFTYLGISLFMTGVNAGFSNLGSLLGKTLALGDFSWMLYLIAFVLGYVVVSAEPAVHVLTKQVSDVSENTINRKTLRICLSIGVAISMLIASLRARFEINILYFVLPMFVISLTLSLYNPKLFTAVAFDSGGISSGIMSATFLLPFVEGIALAFGSDMMIGAFGTIALISTTPILVVQILGAIAKFTKTKRTCQPQKQTKKITILDFDY